MPLAIDSALPAAKHEARQTSTLTSAFGSAYSIAEINAYIAVRDQLLAEAEELRFVTADMSLLRKVGRQASARYVDRVLRLADTAAWQE